MKNLLVVLALGLLLGIANSCYYDITLEKLDEPADPNAPEVSFANDILPIFNRSCNSSGCHNTGGTAPDLSASKAYNALTTGNYINTTSPENSELYQWLKGARRLPMPLSGSDQAINTAVLTWIRQGAKNN